MKDENYNGWKNKSTWNVALWIQNDEGMYRSALFYAKAACARTSKRLYSGFIHSEGLGNSKTPDGIKWLSTRLDYDALNEMMRELGA